MRGLATAILALGLIGGAAAQLNSPQPAVDEQSINDELDALFADEAPTLSEGEEVLEEADEEALVQQPTYIQRSKATLRALDKITGRSTDFEISVGEPKVFGSLRIDLQVCYQRPPEEPPESVAFLRVLTAASKQVQTMAVPRDLTEDERILTEADDADVPFSGWMFASSPGLNALEHPVYDIWVISCTASDPVTPAAGIE